MTEQSFTGPMNPITEKADKALDTVLAQMPELQGFQVMILLQQENNEKSDFGMAAGNYQVDLGPKTAFVEMALMLTSGLISIARANPELRVPILRLLDKRIEDESRKGWRD